VRLYIVFIILLSFSALVTAQAPSIVDGGVLNAGSFAKDGNGLGSAVAPGSLVAIFGSFPGASLADADTVPFSTSLGGVSVTFNGIPAPLKNIVPTGAFPFVNAQIPFGVQPGTANVVVTVNGVSSAPKPTPVVAAAPGVFTIPPNGQGNAILVFLDPADGVAKIAAPTSASATIGYPTAPIARGQSGFFYATGLGVLTPPVPDGSGGDPGTLYLAVTPTVLVGGITAQAAAAQAPGYPGVNQVNVTIPQGAPTGDKVSLQVRSVDGTVTSTALATVAIK
jgi:uncharacterized protein (TIGR03437 family)